MAQTSVGTILTPPKGPDGRPLYQSKPITQTISVEELNRITDYGRNTEEWLRNAPNNINSGITDNEPQTLVSNINSAAAGGTDISSKDPAFNALATDNSRVVGQQLWNYVVKFFNHVQTYEIKPHVIKQLCIEDDLLTWPLRGYIIVDNPHEAFERSFTDDYYHIRSDARDEIFITVWPSNMGELPDEIWKLEAHCVIYDVEDLPHVDNTQKLKKLYFWDKQYQSMLEKNVQWSTSTGTRYVSKPCPQPIAHQSDMLRSMTTGEAIASLLVDSGYEKIIDFDNWDWGVSRINFTCRADWSIWECIQYILNQHVSKRNDDMCLLEWHRGKRKLQLLPLTYYFENAGNAVNAPGSLQLEHLFFEESAGKSESPGMWIAPYLENSTVTKDIKTTWWSRVPNYQFSQTAGLDSSLALVTKPVHSHWYRKNQFNVDVSDNEIQNVRKQYFDNYVNKLLGKYTALTLNRVKKEELSIDPQFSPISTLDNENDKKSRNMASGKGKIIYSGLFLNQTLSLKIIGSTHRHAGTFIGVDRLDVENDTMYDYKVCGQYLVVNVKHVIQHQKYANYITAVKINTHKPMPNNEEIY